jgi:hypothetical protein
MDWNRLVDIATRDRLVVSVFEPRLGPYIFSSTHPTTPALLSTQPFVK